jgi:hypothetical protein
MKTLNSLLLLLVATLVITPLTVIAQDNGWELLTTGGGNNYYYNTNYIYKSPGGTTMLAWIRKSPKSDSTTLSQDLLEFDCNSGKYRVRQTEKSKVPGSWSFMPPDSVVEEISKYVCLSSGVRQAPSPSPTPSRTPSYVPTFPEDDHGLDLAIITANKANMRDTGSFTGSIVRELDQGSLLVLLEREPTGDWYHALDVDSSSEGGINKSVAEVRLTENKRNPNVFHEEDTGRYENPYAEVTNSADVTLYLKIGSKRYTLASHSSQRIDLMPGSQSFYASSPGVIPLAGTHVFKAGYSYTWEFYIETVRR